MHTISYCAAATISISTLRTSTAGSTSYSTTDIGGGQILNSTESGPPRATALALAVGGVSLIVFLATLVVLACVLVIVLKRRARRNFAPDDSESIIS